ncbi:MAG: DUF799 family lipoprotein [Deltaproteobacteria bacterium]|nr:DUF799 family lipoprotein [Deltaproteobacteria bacterium]
MRRGCRSFLLVALICTLGIIEGCLVATETTVISPEIRALFKGTYTIDPYMEKYRPLSVAVLPFIDKSPSQEGADAVRRGFYNHFSSLPFKDVELYRVDNLLKKAGLTDSGKISKTSPQELGKILGADAVVFGDISNFDKLFAVVYSQVSVGAEIKMYDTKTGNFLWSGQHVVRIHEGGIATTPVGIIATVIATSMNMRDIQLLRACDDLFRDMVKTIPVPTLAEALRPPVITLLTQDTKNMPKKAGDEIKVVIQGVPKMQASFDIGEYKKHIDMQEIEPGGYLGVYKVLPGDNVTKAIITGYLSDDAGNTAQWVDAVGTVTLDTTPPDKPKNFTAVGRNNLVLLAWDKSEAHDLAGYRLYWSQTPLSGYGEIAKTEENEYRDQREQALVNAKKYYYRLSAVDQAGNESNMAECIGMPVAPGPTLVSGVLEADTTWYAGASPYVIESAVTVRDKATLTIEPGTDIRSKGGALTVEGRLIAQGDSDHVITFGAAEEGNVWEGVVFMNVKEKENILRFVRVRHARAGVAVRASSPLVESSEFTDNETALLITGAFSKPRIYNNLIHKNRGTAVLIQAGAQPELNNNGLQENEKEAILVQGAAPLIRRNRIAHNRGTGITVHNSQAVIGENNITDNTPYDLAGNMTGEPVMAVNNWWGSTTGLEILRKILGRINVKSVLDAPYPEGKTQELPIVSGVLGGPLNADAFLVLSNSPYRVTRDLVIGGGATLYIEPGVTLQYDQNTAIIAEDGGVVARGTSDLPITFTASGASPAPGFYGSAVRFAKPTKINSAFAYTIVRYATTAFDVYYGTPEISLSLIAASAQNGIYCRNDAAPKIFFNTFTNNLGEGAIKCVGMSNPTIHNNNFLDNTVAVQTFSSIHIDARQNWWGGNPMEQNLIWGDNINIKPWLAAPDDKAYREK